MPLALAVTWTGPRWWTAKPSSPSNAGIQVGDDADRPAARLVDRFERGRCGFLVARAERARTIRVGLDLAAARREVGRTIGSVGDDRDPASRQLVEAHLTHSVTRIRPPAPVRERIGHPTTHRAPAPHADVAFVAVAEIAVAEAQPPVLELEPGRRRHRVELGRGCVADRPRSQADAARLGELDELPLGELLAPDRGPRSTARPGRPSSIAR